MAEKSPVAQIATHENLVRILDSLKEGIIAHDLHRRIFFFNAEAERITGYDRTEVLGLSRRLRRTLLRKTMFFL